MVFLLRIRSNLGTWKLPLPGGAQLTIGSVRQHLVDSKQPPLRLTQELSRDPAGTQVLGIDDSLVNLGLDHGSMIYCRLADSVSVTDTEQVQQPVLDATTSTSNRDTNQNNSNSLATKEPTVIDLLDSDDDEDEIIILPTTSSTDSGNANSKKRKASSAKSSSSTNTNSKRTATSTSKNPKAANQPDQELKDHPSSFQIASYNVWFGPPDPTARQVHPEARMEAIAKELSSCGSHQDLLFVGFQELTESLRDYLKPHMQAMNYQFCTQPLQGAYGVGLAISNAVRMVDYKFLPFSNSTQGRGLLYVQTPTILFGTSHLESFVDAKTYNGVRQREAQIVQAATFCQDRLREDPSLQVAILAGDFNWDDERKRKGTAPNTPLLDLLAQQGCGRWQDSGTPFDYTYDGKENPMLAGNLRRRFDRCISLTRPEAEAPSTTLRKLGLDALPGKTWNKLNPYNGSSRVVPVAPSDHFGIAVSFQNDK